MLNDLWEQILVFVGFVGAFFAGVIGLITKHTDQDAGVNWKRVWRETPIAIFAGMLAHGIGALLEWPLPVIIPMASAIAYIGPAVVIGLLESFYANKFGAKNGRKNRE